MFVIDCCRVAGACSVPAADILGTASVVYLSVTWTRPWSLQKTKYYSTTLLARVQHYYTTVLARVQPPGSKIYTCEQFSKSPAVTSWVGPVYDGDLLSEALNPIMPTTSTSNVYQASLVYLVSINLLKFSSSFRHCCRLFVVLCCHLEATELGKRSPSYTAPTQLVTAGDAPKQYSSGILERYESYTANQERIRTGN